jgi:hypothetical protein
VTNNILRGGVITSFEKRSYGVIELLAVKLRDRIHIIHYGHPNEIDVNALHFMIVFSPDDLARTVATYHARHKAPPLIIHIDTPGALQAMDYAVQFPNVEIAPIEQADLTSKDVTLQLDLFEQIIEYLDRL